MKRKIRKHKKKKVEKVKELKLKIGTKVAKEFGGHDFLGVVIAFNAEIKCWRVRYEDNDVEDMDTAETLAAAQHFLDIDDFRPSKPKKKKKEKKKKKRKRRMQCLICDEFSRPGEKLFQLSSAAYAHGFSAR